jgi:tripartite-type tricarboxylate transporter receptor subunit TctC
MAGARENRRCGMRSLSGNPPVEALPAVPPLTGIGLPGFHEESWFMFLAPARTPRDIADKLAAAMRAALREPALRADLTGLGLIPAQSPGELQKFVRDEILHVAETLRAIRLAGAE